MSRYIDTVGLPVSIILNYTFLGPLLISAWCLITELMNALQVCVLYFCHVMVYRFFNIVIKREVWRAIKPDSTYHFFSENCLY